MSKKKLRILAINPGSTSTKIGVYENNKNLFTKTIYHPVDELAGFTNVLEQKELRKNLIIALLIEMEIPLDSLAAIVGRGGMVKPLASGTYLVNEKLLEDLNKKEAGQHASTLGGIIAHELGKKLAIPAYIVDPVTADEMLPLAKITGIKGVARNSIFHALNSKYVAKRFCREHHLKYEESNLVVAHLGGGITVSAHSLGKVVDVSNGIDGEGPFTPERSGALPVAGVIDLCFSGKYTKEELKSVTVFGAGMKMHLGTNDLRAVEKRIEGGDEEAKLVVEAMAYQVSKEIGAMLIALAEKANGVILTGGLAHSQKFTQLIKARVEKLAPIFIYPGEDELLALTEGALAVLTGKEPAKIY